MINQVQTASQTYLMTYQTTYVPWCLTFLIDYQLKRKTDFDKPYGQYSDLFVVPDGRVGQTDLVRHKIKLRDETPIKISARRLLMHQREIATEEIDKMLNQGIIELSESPLAAPILNTARFCVDFRKFNSKTIKDSYPLRKCTSFQGEVRYLEHIVSVSGIKLN